MSLRGNAKRLYQRDYMRRRRASFLVVGGSRGGSNRKTTVIDKEDVRPHHRYSPPTIYGMNARRMRNYMDCLRDRGVTLQAFEPMSGEIVETVSRISNYRMVTVAASTSTLQHQAGRIAVLEQRIIQLEAGLALHEAQEAYVRDAERR